ncbi:putative FMN-dependent NADH-azoreductase [Paraburkholderia sabiae]|nr:putative FMN-dependent NADH-azoreductase [Paraburkholderia sabiae]
MNILHIDCSPRRESHSRQLSAAIVAKLLTILPDAHIHRRDLGYEPIPHAGADYADALSTPASLAAAGRSADAVLLAEQLIEEVERSDVIVIGTPMNNFTVPSVLKAWIDQILRVGLRRLRCRDEREYERLLLHHATGHRRNGKAFERPRGQRDRQHRRHGIQRRIFGTGGVDQGRSERRHKIARHRVRAKGHSRECCCARNHQITDARPGDS